MQGLVLNEKNKIIMGEYINRFLDYIDVSDNTIKTYNVGLLQFIDYLKNNSVQEPTREDIISFREYLKEEQLKPNTINAYLIAIRNFYGWLEYEGITKDITKKVKGIKLERKHLKRGLSLEEIKQVLNVCKDLREELMIKIMINCGLRCNEVVNIQLADFYNDKGVVMMKVLGKARGGLKQDSIKIDNRLFELIQEYVKQYDIKDYLFVSTSNHNTNGKLTTKTIRYIVKNLFERAGLDMEMLTAHSTRHTTCELLLEKGMPIQEVSEFMRHKNINTTIIYSKELDARNSQASNILCDEIFG